MTLVRINKYLSENGFCSRRAADELVKAGRVFINGIQARLGSRVQDGDEVKVEGKQISRSVERKIYLAYYKPVGVICTNDPKSTNNIIQSVNFPQRVFPVGRLDVQSAGLIFLTNDGNFANQLSHPKFEHQKEYLVLVDKSLSDEFFKKMKSGVKLAEGFAKADKLEKLADKEFAIVIHQGWNKQIRRMCEKLGYQVKGLTRIKIGSVSLDNLPLGKTRLLSPVEVKKLLV